MLQVSCYEKKYRINWCLQNISYFRSKLVPSIGHNCSLFFKKTSHFLQANKFCGSLYQTITFQLRSDFNIRHCSYFLTSLLQKVVYYYFCVIKYWYNIFSFLIDIENLQQKQSGVLIPFSFFSLEITFRWIHLVKVCHGQRLLIRHLK